MGVKKVDSVVDELPSVEGIGQLAATAQGLHTGLCILCNGICNMFVVYDRLREALSYEMCTTLFCLQL